jgi:hypothetical protein
VSSTRRDPVQVEILAQSLLRRKSFNHDRPSFRSHASTRPRVAFETPDSLGKLRIVARREQKASSAILDEFRDSADRAPNHRELTCQAFEDHQPGGLGPNGWADEAVGGLHVPGYIHLVAEEMHPVLQTQCLAEICEAPRIGAISYDPRDNPPGKSPEGPKDDVDPLPVDQLSDHEDYKAICDVEFFPEMRSPDVVRPKTLGVDEMGAGTEVWPYALSFEALQDKITDAEDFTVPPK